MRLRNMLKICKAETQYARKRDAYKRMYWFFDNITYCTAWIPTNEHFQMLKLLYASFVIKICTQGNLFSLLGSC